MIVAGVDGCPDGWIAAIADIDSGDLSFEGFLTFADLVESLADANAIGVDIPIGLMFGGLRQADQEAKLKLVGKKSSVFPAPHPAIRYERDYRNAVELSNVLVGKGLSQQAFAILPKIAEVNDYMNPDMQGRIFEVHPEVSFATLNGKPVLSKKGEIEGFDERFALLEREFGIGSIHLRKLASKVVPGMRVNADDTLDAIVAAWTAKRYVTGHAGRIPEIAEFGFRGLRAEIVY